MIEVVDYGKLPTTELDDLRASLRHRQLIKLCADSFGAFRRSRQVRN
jgi:hypothetical protein